ncbi:hypothetical protein TWF281_003509 [Arthrobotrys megalospora]
MRFYTLAGLGILFPLTSAYEIAFYPYFLTLHTGENYEPNYRVYPRFKCNAVPPEDLDGDPFARNVLVRTAADSVAPKVIVFYDNEDAGDVNPCRAENATVAAYFFRDRKPSQQILDADAVGKMTHFMEISEQSEEWAFLVDWLELEPGLVAVKDLTENAWFIADPDFLEVEIRGFDSDFGYDSAEDFSNGVDSEGNSESPAEDVEWPEMEQPYGTRFAPGQKVPDEDVYRSGFRDWRNARIKWGDYRSLPSEFTDKYPFDELRGMGYITNEEKEAKVQEEKRIHQQMARQLEREYEEDRLNQLRSQEKYTPTKPVPKVVLPADQGFLEDVVTEFGDSGSQETREPLSGFQGLNNIYIGLQQEGVNIEEEEVEIEKEVTTNQQAWAPGNMVNEADNEDTNE